MASPQNKPGDIEARWDNSYNDHQNAAWKAEGLPGVRWEEPAEDVVPRGHFMWSLDPQHGSAVLLDADLSLPNRARVEGDQLHTVLISGKFDRHRPRAAKLRHGDVQGRPCGN